MPDLEFATAASIAIGVAGALLAKFYLDRPNILPSRQRARMRLALGRKWWRGDGRRDGPLFRTRRAGGTASDPVGAHPPEARLRLALRRREIRQFWPPLPTR